MFEVRVIFTFNDSQLVMLPLEIGKAGGAYGRWWWGKPKWEGVGKNGGEDTICVTLTSVRTVSQPILMMSELLLLGIAGT